MLEWNESISVEEARLTLNGKITFENAGDLRNRVKELILNHPVNRLVFDLSQVGFIDSSGLGLLVSIKNTMVKREGTFRLEGVTDTVRNIMAQTGLDRYFEI